MTGIDDSSLFHASSTYDPVKAREYYLRTRKLKGRRPSTASIDVAGKGGRRPTNAVAKVGKSAPDNSQAKRRAELKAQRAALDKRLDRLKQVLRELVDAAQKSNGPTNPGDSKGGGAKKDQAPETQADRVDREKASKKSKPESTSQKKERAKKAKEAYEKENPGGGLSKDVEVLKAQIEDIEAKIRKALSDASAREKKGGSSRVVAIGNSSSTKVSQTRASTSRTNSVPQGR